MPSYNDAQHGTGLTVHAIPAEPMQRIPATPQQIANDRAEADNLFARAHALQLDDDPAIKQAQGKYQLIQDVISKGGKPSAFDLQSLMLSVKGPASLRIVGKERELEDTKNMNEAASAARPKSLDDAVGRLTQAQLAYQSNPTAENKKAVSDAQLARTNFLSAEGAKERTAQAIKDGDPAAMGHMLAQGLVAPSEVISARQPAFAAAALQAANGESLKTTGKPFVAQKAEADYKYATNPLVQGTLNMISSMTGEDNKSGTLAILQKQAGDLKNGDIQVFNKVGNEISMQAGYPELAAFNATLLGVVDEYAKVLGGGQATDSARKEAASLFPDKFSPKQAAAAVDSIRQTMALRKQAMIRDNPALNKAYGGEQPQASQSSGHKLGDVIVQGNKSFRVTTVDSGGKVLSADPQ